MRLKVGRVWLEWNVINNVTKSNFIFFPSGDKLYPMDTSGESGQGMSAQDCGLHRMVILGSHTLNLQVTITPKYNQLAPVTGPVGSHDPNSHL